MIQLIQRLADPTAPQTFPGEKAQNGAPVVSANPAGASAVAAVWEGEFIATCSRRLVTPKGSLLRESYLKWPDHSA